MRAARAAPAGRAAAVTGGGEAAVRAAVEAAPEFEPPEGGTGDHDVNLRLAYYEKNDVGNAKRLMDRYGRDLIFVQDIGWHIWLDGRWSRETGEREAHLICHRTADAIKAEAKALETEGPFEGEKEDAFDERIAKHFKWSIASGNSNRIAAMLREAAPYLQRQIEEMDADPWLLNLANGTLEMRPSEQGGIKLRAHRREDLISKISPVAYEPEAEAPLFRRFLGQIMPDRTLQVFLQRWFGYSLTGDISEQCLALFYGIGANGKSTLVELMGWIAGNYALTLPFASLLHDERRRGSEPSPDIARLPGARLVAAAEPEAGTRFSESLLKSLTGGDRVTARHLQKDFFEFKPSFKLSLSFNIKPSVRGQDEGIWRRLLMVPFDVTVPAAERDLKLSEKLRTEGSGVLNWALDGLRLWLEDGLQTPDAVRAATEAYRSESDPVGQFLEAATLRAKGAHVRAKDLFDAYIMWCKNNAVTPLTQTGFGRRIGDRGIEKEKAGTVFYKDLELHDDYKPRSDPPPPEGYDGP